ncbi:hypothetical protein LOZ80_34800 [Paenibacillus sp. HWE-109]|uniref:hypothetical protein n=1 Tax=Paenibacillus sp. HWE-109 TaxID=1306526 RepID=UPI001EDD5055|nr:hypothetical protein [Paenibacillus sp. HWE-109]UKS26627.1 hypothetical protein LOZ80_34800 [Paenibacillus sp. HWE-109]
MTNQKMRKSTLLLTSAIIALTAALSPIQALAAPVSPPTTNSIPVPDGSYTLVGESYDSTFVNGQTSIAIGASIKVLLDGIAARYKIKGFWVSGTTGAIGTSIAFQLNSLPKVYYKFRLGISYNDTLKYYEYVNASVEYPDSSYSTPKNVSYWNTGTKVPDETLALYGLKNP